MTRDEPTSDPSRGIKTTGRHTRGCDWAMWTPDDPDRHNLDYLARRDRRPGRDSYTWLAYRCPNHRCTRKLLLRLSAIPDLIATRSER